MTYLWMNFQHTLGNVIGKLSSQNRLEIHSKLCHNLKFDIWLELDQTLNHKSIISVVVECMVNKCKLCKRSEEQARNSISTLQYDPFWQMHHFCT